MNGLSKYLVESILKEEETGIIVLLPGGFKPPHGGHIDLAKKYAALPNVSEVRILIGPKERDGITAEVAKQIWNTLIAGTPNIKVYEDREPNPMRAAYKYIETAKPGTYALGSSSKGGDYERVKQFVAGHSETGKYHRPEVNVVELPLDVRPLLYKGRTDELNGTGISASVLRNDLANKDYQNFKTNYPGMGEGAVKTIFNKLTGGLRETLDEGKINDLIKGVKTKFTDIITNVKKDSIETKKAFGLLLQAAQGKKKLTPEEKTQIGEQLKDVLKTVGLIAASVLPGGVIYFILIKVLKLESLYPKSYRSQLAHSAALLSEGGAAGHMTHPYEDMDLTFADAQHMIEAALSGEIEFAQEKLDGQNLMVTYKDGQVRSARNKGQLKNFAEKSITTKELSQMMAGKGAIQTAFTEAMADLEAAINKLSPEQKADFFENGKKFINFEVLYPETSNVIPYGTTQIRLHGFKEYDEDGNVTREDTQGAYALQKAIEAVQAQNQKTFEIRTTDPVTIKKSADYDKQKSELLGMLDQVKQRYQLGPEDKLGMYFQSWWKDFLQTKAKDYSYEIPDNTLQQLINRWGFGNKEVNIRNIKAGIDNPEFLAWVDQFDRSGATAAQKEARKPIENLFLKLGVYVLQNVEQLVALNYNDSVASMRSSLADAIKQIRSLKDQPTTSRGGLTPLDFLKRELTRLKDIGGFKAVVPTEGIVFKYNGRLYKLTGAFAPINQILGYLRF
jgi:hypothetical protein